MPGEGLAAGAGEGRANEGNEIVVETVLVAAYEGEDEDTPALL